MPKKFLAENEAKAFMNGEIWGRLATIGPEGPYITPLHYVLENNTIYFHSSAQGKKISNLMHDSRVCFEVSKLVKIIERHNPCKFSTLFTSVQVFGKARIINDIEEKLLALNLLAKKFAQNEFEPIYQEQASNVSVIALEIERISGRETKE